MKRLICYLLAGIATTATLSAHSDEASWTQPQKPFQVYGNTYYVGTLGLSAILVTSPQGHVLIDGTLEHNAPLIEANIRALGFRVEDIRVILNSHAHSDHAGGIAELARVSGAKVRASVAGAKAMNLGGNDPDDPQYDGAAHYPVIANIGVVRDGETIRIGTSELIAHYTPGHTPGGTSWTWRSCDQGHCLNMVYADSLTPISSDGFHYSGDATHKERVKSYRQTLATVAALPCDILITPHPDASDLMERVAKRDQGLQPNPLVDTQACKAYAAGAGVKLDARLVKEQTERPH
ncbi:subclass B3 metallo-beta-lactamase [Dyella tabacisoli]|uniref:beta-lactamase n=1 Tax=Dyella tabacisoli TaxID=2282381 RepID=A0A369ULI9_9GAMM|nr:subclass B3 metallo-beta-lactamase [Dyella tabacisoli]RDD81624.1 subclass B3 metallo-beta-lactamase [Dyella tabacisoli]